MLGVNVLQLNQTKIATEEDINNNLVYWANLFMATTWEDFKALAKDNPAIKEMQPVIDVLEDEVSRLHALLKKDSISDK